MASLSQVNIDIKFNGLENLDQATKKMRQVQSEVKRLAKEERAGAISTDQYTKRVGQLASELQRTTRGKIQARNAVNQYSREIRQAITAQAQFADTRAIQRRDAAERKALRDYLRYQREKEAAAQREARVQEQAAAQAIAAQQRLANEMNQLRARFNPLAAASQRYEKELNDLNRAHKLGAVSAKQYETALEQLNIDLANGVTRMSGMGVVAGSAAQRMNRFGVIAQQSGYQIGDFLVQVQSGTNAFVAFGQQATQVAGVLTLLGGKWLAIGVALGILIPLATALAAAFMRTSKDAASASQNIEGSFSKLIGFFDDLGARISGSFDDAFEEIENNYGKMFERLARIRLTETKAALSASFEETVTPTMGPTFMQRFGMALAPGVVIGSPEATRIVSEQIAPLNEQSRLSSEIEAKYLKQVDAASNIEEIIALTVETADELAKISDEAANAFVLMAEKAGITKEMMDRARRASEQAFELDERRVAAMQMYYELVEKELEATKERDAAVKQITDSVEAEKQSLQDRLDIARLTVQFGKDSAEVRAKEAEIAREIYKQEQMRNGVLGNNLRDIMKAYDETVRMERAASRISFDPAAESAAAMNRRLDETLAKLRGILGAIGSIGFDIIATRAETAALRAGRSAAEARIEGIYASDVARGPQTGIAGFANRALANAKRIAGLELAAAQAERDAAATAGGGGGAEEDIFTSRIAGIRELQAAIEEASIRSAEFEQEVSLLDSALENGLITQQRYNELLREAQEAYGQATTGAYDYQSALEQVSDKAKSSMEDAFMSIIDGSKSASDAFRDMARQILAEAIRMLIIRPLLNNLFSAFGFSNGGVFSGGGLIPSANGNAFSNGNVIPFASGGIVSSPTFFPMRGAQTGLMGEAGPEAIMPLKRGRDGKLGVAAEGGGNITVENHFHLSANGDESVKRIIASEAPKIAALTQRQIVDQRRRGGAMKGAFG